MSVIGHARRPFHPEGPAPIKGGSPWRAFLIGWIAILCIATAGYALASSQLAHSSAELRLATVGDAVQPVLADL